MRHFLFEFITGGGLAEQALSETLTGEGELMMQTLLNEISAIEGSEISLCRDSRLALYDNKANQYPVSGNVIELLPGLIKESDVCWLIAPETGNCLDEYSALFPKYGKLFIGSSTEAIKMTTSKYLTNKVLAENDIRVVETKWIDEVLPVSDSGWIVKPDDGVGAENTRLILDKESMSKIVTEKVSGKTIVQPYLQGKHMSMSLLVYDEDVRLLACNQQYIDVKKGAIKLNAIGVNECLMFKEDMLEIAKKIAAAIPGLAGYIGVDLIAVDKEFFVLEINPRFTTAYAGISESIGCNITEKILNTFLNKKLPDISLESVTPVRINI